MKKRIILFVILAFVLGLVLVACDRSRAYECLVYERGNEWLIGMSTVEECSSDKPVRKVSLGGFASKDYIFTLHIKFFKLMKDCPEARISELASQAPDGVYAPSSFSLTLSNGEILRAKPDKIRILDERLKVQKEGALRGAVGSFRACVSCADFNNSNLKDMSGMNNDARYQYVASRLSRYDIVSVQIDDYDFALDAFHSAPTWKTIFQKEAELTGGVKVYDDVESPRLEDSVPISNNSAVPSVEIHGISADYDVEKKGRNGIVVHASLTIHNAAHKELEVTAYFYFENGKALKDYNKDFYTDGGEVCSPVDYTPPSNQMNVTVNIFIPYSELHLASGRHDLKTFVVVWDDHKRELARSDWLHFWVNQV